MRVARAVHRAADRAPAGDVRRRRALRREVADGDALPRARTATYQKVWFELQALAWNRPELRERVAHVQRRVARRAHRGVRASRAERYGIDDAARRARLARDHVQRGDHPRAAVGDRDRARASCSTGSTAGCRGEGDGDRDRGTRASRRAPATRTRRATSSATASASSTRSTVDGEPTVLLLPTWSIIHSRHWKMQIPYLARHCRVLTFDGRGNGRSDRPERAAAYAEREFAADALAVMDATGDRAGGARLALAAARSGRSLLAAEHPERVDGAVFIAPSVPLGAQPLPSAIVHSFDERARHRRGLGEVQPPLLAARLPRTSSSSSSRRCFTEPHSTKQIEDCVGWGLETTPETLVATTRCAIALGARRRSASSARASAARCSSSTATEDAITGARTRRSRSPRRPAASLVTARGSGPRPARRATRSRSTCCCATSSRRRAPPRALGARTKSRRKRALYVSLADRARPRAARRRDRRRAAEAPPRPRDRLARAAPGDRACSRRGASASTRRARCSRTSRSHIECESAEHDLHCFQAIRRMDEILLANFMVFHDLVARRAATTSGSATRRGSSTTTCTRTPSRSAPPYVWLTDFVGWLPMPDGGEREAFLTADYNAEMIEHIARFPRVRDRAIFVGNPDDIVAGRVRPGPAADPRLDGASTSTSPATSPASTRPTSPTASSCAPSSATAPDEQVCIVTVGGSGVGGAPAAARDRRVPGGEGARARAADDRRRRPADRPGDAARGTTGSRCAPTSTTSTGTSPPAISRSSRAA